MLLTKTQPYYNRELNTLFINKTKTNRLIDSIIPQTTSFEKLNIYMTAISVYDSKRLDLYLKGRLSDKRRFLLEEKLKNKIDLTKVIMYGNANKRYTSYGLYKDLFQMKIRNKTKLITVSYGSITGIEYFRNYEQPYENWMETSCYVNMCPDMKMCWQSAIRKLGAKEVHGLENDYKPFYVVLWFDYRTTKEIVKNGF